MPADSLTLFFKDIDKEGVASVGGKAANLGEMIQAGFPVPPGFAITVASYDLFLKENGLDRKIYQILKALDVNDPSQLNSGSRQIQKLIISSQIPDSVSRTIIKSYKKLSGIFRSELVAVRSSATAEDMPKASFAGQQASFLDIKGEANLLMKVRECWASLFTPRSIFYRVENKIPHEKVKIAVIVQKMIQSKVSGVMFSIDPVTNDKERIVIEAVWGLGEMIVQGSVVPDKYVVQKETFSILSKEISDQTVQLIKQGNKTKEAHVPKKVQGKQKITDEEIVKLAKISGALQEHYFFSQDSEWAMGSDRKIFVVQTRPITTTGIKYQVSGVKKDQLKNPQTPILIGTPASPGIGTGTVKILKSPKEVSRIKEGDVLVAPMTSPDYVIAMKKASAIITDQGGQTSHAAIVSRELGIPCVVGTKMATTKLKEGVTVTVDGKTGEIFLGSSTVRDIETRLTGSKSARKTATKLYVNLGEPDLAKKVSGENVDGVGLLRAEFMIESIGIHPKEAIKRKEQDKFIDKLIQDLETFCKNFLPRPVIYRATDFKTNEYKALPGGRQWEPDEANPLLGFRGALRYIADPEVFNLELTAIKKVREKYNNLWLMIPFVRSPQELLQVRKMVAVEGLFESSTFKFWMMVELPINVILLEEFIKVGLDGVSVGSNDLTMLITGVDRDNAEVARDFDERSPALLWALKRIVRICNKNRVTSSICGQAPSQYEDLVEFLVKEGITSISVNPDAIERVRSVIIETEKQIVAGSK